MIILLDNDGEERILNGDEYNNYIESNDNLNIKKISILDEISTFVNSIQFIEGVEIVQINFCNLLAMPMNIPTNIIELNLSYNNLRSLNLINFTNLKNIIATNNRLSLLEGLNDTIESIKLNNNSFTFPPSIPENLRFLNISNNILVRKPEVNDDCVLIDRNNIYAENNVNTEYTIDFTQSNNFYYDILPYQHNNSNLFENNNVPTYSETGYEDIPSPHHTDTTSLIDLDEITNISSVQFSIPLLPTMNLENNLEEEYLNDDDLDDDYFDDNNDNDINRYREKIKIINKLYSEDKIKIPENYLCPISKLLLYKPVCVSDGHTYEKDFIKEWLTYSDKSPMTNLSLKNKILFPNLCLKSIIQNWIDDQTIELDSEFIVNGKNISIQKTEGNNENVINEDKFEIFDHENFKESENEQPYINDESLNNIDRDDSRPEMNIEANKVNCINPMYRNITEIRTDNEDYDFNLPNCIEMINLNTNDQKKMINDKMTERRNNLGYNSDTSSENVQEIVDGNIFGDIIDEEALVVDNIGTSLNNSLDNNMILTVNEIDNGEEIKTTESENVNIIENEEKIKTTGSENVRIMDRMYGLLCENVYLCSYVKIVILIIIFQLLNI